MGRVKEFYTCPACMGVGAACSCFPEPDMSLTSCDCGALVESDKGICDECREVAEAENERALAIAAIRSLGLKIVDASGKEITA